jgi:hypothetical protein
VILPTLNEELGLRATLAEIHRTGFGPDGTPEILVVDGHSEDRSREIADAFGCFVLEQSGHGKGSAVREGLAWARREGFGTVALLDADGTYPAARLPALFRLLEEGFEVVVGVRRPDHPAGTTPRDLVHRIGNGLLDFLAARFSGGPILDVCSGFWGVRTEVLEGLRLESNGFEIESELFVKSFRHGLRVVQIPIAYRERIGEAKLHAVRDGARILLSILRHSRSRPTLPTPGRRSPEFRGAAPGLTASPLPALVAVLATLDPDLVVVSSSKRRQPEAARMTERLPNVSAAVDLELSGGDPIDRLAGADSWDLPGAWPHRLADRPVVVSLPDAPLGFNEIQRVDVSIPGQDWVLSLGPTDSRAEARARPAVARRPTDRRLGLLPNPTALSILAAVLDTSWVRRERTVLAANLVAVGGGVHLAPRPLPASSVFPNFVRSHLPLLRHVRGRKEA